MKRSSMFLLELLAMVLVFSLCAAVCISIIGKSWTISQRSDQLTQAVYLAETVAAQVQSGRDLPIIAEDGFAVSKETVDTDGDLPVVRITVSYDGEIVYSLDVTHGEVLA